MLFRSEARFGAAAYAKLQRITCEEWVSYLQWLRRMFDLPVENGVKVDTFEPEGALFRLAGRRNGKPETWYCRRLILASGPLSTGGTSIPEAIVAGLPRAKYGHVYDSHIDFDALKGKSIIMIGCGASGFDNSGTALESGAARVDMLVRRPAIPRVSYIRWTDWSAFLNTFADLDDEQKWKMASWVQKNHSPPPGRALERVDKRPDFHIHFNSPITSARVEGDKVVLVTPNGEHRADHVLCATGFSFRLDRAPLFAKVWPHIALWKDRYTPKEAGGSEKFPYSPYVGRHYEFIEKNPGEAPWLKHVYCFTQAATLSMGPTGRVSGLKYGVRRLLMGVSQSFFQEDFDLHLKSIERYADSEFDDHPWVAKA